MINVNFTMVPTIDNKHSMNVMWCSVTKDDEEYELYAEDMIPDDCPNLDDFDGDSYLRLKAEIEMQAEDIGYDPDELKFFWD